MPRVGRLVNSYGNACWSLRTCRWGLGDGVDPEMHRHGASESAAAIGSLTLNRFRVGQAKAAGTERESAGRESNPQLALAGDEPSPGHGV